MTSILGISAFYHDSAAALIVDGKIIGPDVFSFAIDEKENVLIKKLKSMNILNLKTSYGGGDSRIESTPIEITNKTWCRISIGYNDNYEKLQKAMETMTELEVEYLGLMEEQETLQ